MSQDLDSEEEFRIHRIPTVAFGREYNNIPEHVRQDLETLNREGAIYHDHWIEEIQDFRHVKITFTEDERREFSQRCWAYELWLGAGSPKWVRDVPGVDADIAKDADSYVLLTRDGVTIGPPYLCFAAFLGKHLESLTCGMLKERRIVIELSGREGFLHGVRRVIESLTPTIRSFNNREKGLKPWSVEREDDARDLLYVMLRPLVFDLAKEEPIPSRGGTYKFVDLFSNASKLLIEVKWIGKRGQWKRIAEEISVDIQAYITHPACETLFFVVLDAARDIPDPRRFESEISGEQVISGKKIAISVLVSSP